MIVNKFEIQSDSGSGALLRLFHSQADVAVRPLFDHHHTMIEISLIKEGHGRYTIGDADCEINPGDVFVFAGDEPHCITEIDSAMLIMNIHFEPRFIWSPGNSMFDAKFLRIFLDSGPGFRNQLDQSSRGEITELMLSMENEFESKLTDYELMVKIRLLNILVLLGRAFGIDESVENGMTRPNLNALDSAMEFISAHLDSPLSLDDLSRKAGMSRAYFSTMFKRLYGISPWEYIAAKRVEAAVVLLETSRLSIIDIAYRCGFNSTANFNRAFKKITGRTPSSFR